MMVIWLVNNCVTEVNPIIKTRQTPATLHQLLFYTVKELYNIRSR